MAESKYSRNEDNGTVSAESGSEFVFEHICQPCSTEHVLEATGFCIDCQEWLCGECYKYHRRPTPMRNHHLKDIEQMKASMPSATGKDRCTQTCEEHEGKKLKYFCSKHDSFGCSTCIFQNHKGCSMESIQELAQDIFNQSEFTSLMDRFRDAINTTKELKNEVKQHTSQTSRKHSEATEATKTFIEELSDALREIKNDLAIKCSLHEEAEIKKLESLNEICKTVQTQSQVLTSKIDDMKERNQKSDAFVAMKRAATMIKPLEDEVKEARGSIRASNYSFTPTREILQTLRRPGGVGTLADDEEYEYAERYYSNLKAEHLKDIPLGKNCIITGSVLFSSNRLVLADYINRLVKVLDTDQDRLVSEIKVDGTPWSLAIMNDTSFAVTICDKSKILIFNLRPSGYLCQEKSITVIGQCFGIAFNNNNFFVTFLCPEKVELIDRTGSVLRTLVTNEKGQPSILSTPQYAVLSPDKQSLYVSNLNSNKVVCLRLDSTVVAKYEDDELIFPRQAAVDENGMIFLSASFSHNVHLITPDCKKVKVLLTEAEGVKLIHSISYCARRHRLYIGMDNCDKIKVFELK